MLTTARLMPWCLIVRDTLVSEMAHGNEACRSYAGNLGVLSGVEKGSNSRVHQSCIEKIESAGYPGTISTWISPDGLYSPVCAYVERLSVEYVVKASSRDLMNVLAYSLAFGAARLSSVSA